MKFYVRVAMAWSSYDYHAIMYFQFRGLLAGLLPLAVANPLMHLPTIGAVYELPLCIVCHPCSGQVHSMPWGATNWPVGANIRHYRLFRTL